jgi:hypothetical protein
MIIDKAKKGYIMIIEASTLKAKETKKCHHRQLMQ